MKKLFFIAVSMLLSTAAWAETVSATDSRITFVGRSVIENDSYRFDFPSTYFRVAFTGKKLSMRVTDTKRNYYAVFVNTPTSAEPTRIVEVKGTDTIIDLVLPADLKSLKTKEYQVVIQRRTEANCGTTTVKEFITDGKFLQAEPLKTRQIEFIGDSYTCGYGIDAPSRRDPSPARGVRASCAGAPGDHSTCGRCCSRPARPRRRYWRQNAPHHRNRGR